MTASGDDWYYSKGGEPVGPLHGVPVAIKDLTPTKGKRTTMGSYAFEHWVPEESAVLVERLLGATLTKARESREEPA